jgi:hypothetical protein
MVVTSGKNDYSAFHDKSRSMELSWDASLEDGKGPDPAGISLFETDGGGYHGFDVELESAYPPQRGTIPIPSEEDERFHPDGGILFAKHHKRGR